MASGDLVLAGIVWTVLGILVAIVAALRGRPFWPWLLYSIAFWPLALVHIIFWKPRIRDAGPLDEDGE
jgi:membrane protein implicated in regulation of membrane protease activity